jgi:general secretion pathway protein I
MKAEGFTLIEILVAVVVLAITLMAGMKASSSLILNTERQWQVLLAQICADNALNQLRLMQQLPNLGQQTQTCPQAEFNFNVLVTVSATPNLSMRRVDAQVVLQSTPILNVTTAMGRY